jgi:putative transcriptional regulator
MITHHPLDATLVAAAAGTLPAPHLRVLAVHLAHCPACAGALRAAEAVGGGLLADLPPAPLRADALDRALARLDDPAPLPAPASVTPAVTLAGLATGRWRRITPWIAMMALSPRDTTDSRLDLIRVRPGAALLSHGHTGLETTCVLQGAFDDGTAQYGVGDFAEGDPALEHQPRALPGETCVCLIATTGALRPHGWFGRMVRPMIGM